MTRTPPRRKASKAERRAEILAIAADLFASRGYWATTVRNIGEEAGILSGSLYHHFDSKESMLDEILSGFIAETAERYEAAATEQPPLEALKALVRASFEALAEDRSACLVYRVEAGRLAEEPRFAYLRDAETRFERIWSGVLRQGVSRGEFGAHVNPGSVYRLVQDAIWAPDSPMSTGDRRERQEEYLAIVVGGVAARAQA